MERERPQGSRGKQDVGRKIIAHGGKDRTVDMSINPDKIFSPVNPKQTLRDIKLLGQLGRKPKKVNRK